MTAEPDLRPIVTGKCLCHGITITGSQGTVAQPDPYWLADLWGGPRTRCVAVQEDGTGQPHDVPLGKLR